jgi:bifunctional non-homologous end joining protein LigD
MLPPYAPMIPTQVYNGVDHTRRFPELALAVAALPGRTLVLDGEVVTYDQQLRSRFDWPREQDPDAVATPPLSIAVDLLYCDGRDLTARPLRDRRRASTLGGASPPTPEFRQRPGA